ncbi:MAG: ABC transporter substrate-binding protein [Candidatus Zipacnadales bacterium]
MTKTPSILPFAVGLILVAGCLEVKKEEQQPFASSGSATPAREEVELVMYTWTEAKEEEANQVLLREFEQANPGIKVELQNTAGSQEAMAKLQTLISGQEAPDLVSLHGAYYIPFASKGALLPLDEYIAQSQELSLDDFPPRLLKLCRHNGKLYSLPRYTSVYVLFYNKDLFDAAGVEYPERQNPWNWDAYLRTVKQLTKDLDGDGKTDQWGCIIDFWEARVYPWIWQNGGDIFNEDRSRCILDEPEAVEALQFVADLLLKHKVTPQTLSTERNQGLQVFSQGNIGMYMTGPWDIQTLAQATREQGLNWGIAPLPKQKRAATMLGTENYAICSQCKHPDEAWKLFEFLMTSHAQEYMAEQLEKMPSRLSVIQGPYIHADVDYNRSVLAEALNYAIEPPNVPDWAQIRPLFQEELDNIWIGRKSAKEACHDAAWRINKYRAMQAN